MAHACHCEEWSDEAIQKEFSWIATPGDTGLAMTMGWVGFTTSPDCDPHDDNAVSAQTREGILEKLKV